MELFSSEKVKVHQVQNVFWPCVIYPQNFAVMCGGLLEWSSLHSGFRCLGLDVGFKLDQCYMYIYGKIIEFCYWRNNYGHRE